jgi:GMP synthase (glutamine-hydrolysing)
MYSEPRGEVSVRPILVVDCYVDGDGVSNYRRVIHDRPLEFWRPADAPRPRHVQDFSGIVITGSAACVTTPEPWMDLVVDLVLDANVSHVPILGICFGHQIVAHALFGSGTVRRSATPEVGWVSINQTTQDDPIFEGVEANFTTFMSHFDEVQARPGMTVLATTDRCEVAAYRVGKLPVWGLQFHAEMDQKEAEDLVGLRISGWPGANTTIEEARAGSRDSTGLVTQLFKNFFQTL